MTSLCLNLDESSSSKALKNELYPESIPTSPDIKINKGTFFSIGNPLLDMSVEVDHEFLQRYNLKCNGIVLATNEHNELFDEVARKARHTSGGSSQNIMRTIVWFLQQPEIATFMGCVGDDFDYVQLKEIGEAAGLATVYQIHESLRTGRCAILVNSRNQSVSMVANLGAAEAFTHDFLEKEENWKHVEQANILLSEGYFLASNREAFMRVCEYAHKKRKIFCMTLAAKYICNEMYGNKLLSVLPYADVVFGREEEVKAFAQSQLDVTSNDLYETIKAVQDALKWNSSRSRIVVIFKLKSKTIISTDKGIKEYRWRLPNKIIDTHGCVDAFIGGFLAYMALSKDLDECARAGLYCTYENLQQLGCQFPSCVSYNAETFCQSEED